MDYDIDYDNDASDDTDGSLPASDSNNNTSDEEDDIQPDVTTSGAAARDHTFTPAAIKNNRTTNYEQGEFWV